MTKPAKNGSAVFWSDLTVEEKLAVKVLCEKDHLFFTRFFFKERIGQRFNVGPHHKLIGRAIDDVIAGRISRLLITVPPGYTKAIDCDTPMWTPDGWRLARDIGVGHKLMGSDGRWTSVVGIAPQGVKPAYRVTFSDGVSLVACDDHRWAVKQRYGGPWRVKTTADLIGDLEEADGRKKWRIPVVNPSRSERSKLPIDPYLLGCWLGDGHTHQAAITTMDTEIVRAFEAAGYEVKAQKCQNAGRATTYGINGGFMTALKSLGLLGSKSIPDRYLLASLDDRIALLQGICDTDGGVGPTNGQQSVSSSHPVLAEQIKTLICSIGGVYRCYASKTNGVTSQRLGLTMPANVSAFRLSRKAERVNPRSECNLPRRFISSIEPVSPREMICFAVDAPDHLFCAGRDLIVTHNTEEAVIAFIARGMALTKGRAKFIHASFSGPLVKENSNAVRDTITTEPFQEMWGIAFDAEMSGKERWITTEGGGLLAKPAGGPITGFRAGLMLPTGSPWEFTGALVIDDPLKPDDIFTIEREKINKRWDTTFKSRLATEDVPVIVIMQRLHPDDFAGFLLKGGANCQWHHLMLPALIDNAEPYPKENTHGIPIPHGLPDGPLWSDKHNRDHLEVLAADPFTWASQYQQRPMAAGGNVFKPEWLVPYNEGEHPPLEWRGLYADTAQKVGAKNDFTAIGEWGRGKDGRAYQLAHVKRRMTAPELLRQSQILWNAARSRPVHTHGVCRYFGIEDKVSGTGLIQQLAAAGVPVKPLSRPGGKDKFQAAQDVIPYFAADRVRLLGTDAPWRRDYWQELLSFTGQGDTFDDQADMTIYAVDDILAGGISYEAWT